MRDAHPDITSHYIIGIMVGLWMDSPDFSGFI
jgi:hypothetical protein